MASGDSTNNGASLMKESDRKMQRKASSGSDESTVHMRIGPEYQATIPSLQTEKKQMTRGPPLVIWKPFKLAEDKLVKFIDFSRNKYGYREEQSLGLLWCHKYNVDEANKDLVNFVPYPDDWTPLEKSTFEVGFQEHGKDFHKIKMMLPDKSVNNIVKYYYIWKKSRGKYQTLKNKMRSRRNVDSDDDSNDDYNGHKSKRIRMGSSSLMTSNFTQSQIPIIQALYNTTNGMGSYETCSNCHRAKAVFLVTLKREYFLCAICSDYYQKYSAMRPLFENAVVGTGESNEKTLSPPEGVDITIASLRVVASPKEAHNFFACLTNQIMTYKTKTLEARAKYDTMRKEFEAFNIEQYREPAPTSSSKTWSNFEVDMMKMSFKTYGKDFESAAMIVRTKTANQCRNIYYNKKNKEDFDSCVEEYERKMNESSAGKETEKVEPKKTEPEKMEIIDDDEIQIIDIGKKHTSTPDNIVFNVQFNGMKQPVRLQRVPIQLSPTQNGGDPAPMIIDLTDDDDDSRPAISLGDMKVFSKEKQSNGHVTMVTNVIHVVDDDIQILDSNGVK